MGYGHREATGTSLAAIAVIGALAAGGARGSTATWTSARASSSPRRRSRGVLAGTALQQRISERAVAGAFVVLLLASAAVLVF